MPLFYNFFRLALLCFALLLLYACDEGKKTAPTQGRIPLNSYVQTYIDPASITSPSLPIAGLPFLDTPINIPSTTTVSEWTQPFHNDNNSLFNFASSSIATYKRYRETFSDPFTSSQLLPPPIVADGILYIADTHGYVLAYSLKGAKPRRLWRLLFSPNPSKIWIVGLSYGAGALYIAYNNGDIAAYDLSSKSVIWQMNLIAIPVSAPVADGSRLFVQTADNGIIALSSADGSVLWKQETAHQNMLFLWPSAPALTGGAVFAGFSNGEVMALKLENGIPLWSENITSSRKRVTEFSSLPNINAPLVIHQGELYAVSNADALVAFSIQRGQELWRRPISSLTPPLVLGNRVYITDTHDTLWILGRSNGAVYHQILLPQPPHGPTARFLFFPPKHNPKGFWLAPLMVNGLLYIPNTKGQVLVVNPDTGVIMDTLPIVSEVFSAPLVIRGRLYFFSLMGVFEVWE